MQKNIIIIFIFAFITGMHACRKAEPFPEEQLDERMSGGDATVFDEGGGAFGHAISGMNWRDEEVHDLGDKLFEAPFVTAPAPLYAGLGPVYNSRNCVSCHIGDGRGKPPVNGEPMQSMFLKLAMPGNDMHGAPLAVPGFGNQLQDKSIAGVQAEGIAKVSYSAFTVTLNDGKEVEMRRPLYSVESSYIPVPAGMVTSARVANPLVGLGLLETIEEQSILKHADEHDVDGDGISGKPNYVYDYIHKKAHVLGRFGWKASSADVKTQTAKALNGDMGITTSLFPQKNAHGQEQMKSVFIQNPYNLHDTMWQAVAFYTKTLAVPARRNTADPVVKSGQALFKQIGCVKCHVDVHMTQTNVAFAPLSGQVIRPYTDMLLHDMGDDLADGYSEFEAKGNEWRTAPLWGLGLTHRVSGHTYLLHDGRARNVTEAILWHGGEAEQVKQKFIRLSAAERNALLKFLGSL